MSAEARGLPRNCPRDSGKAIYIAPAPPGGGGGGGRGSEPARADRRGAIARKKNRTPREGAKCPVFALGLDLHTENGRLGLNASSRAASGRDVLDERRDIAALVQN